MWRLFAVLVLGGCHLVFNVSDTSGGNPDGGGPDDGAPDGVDSCWDPDVGGDEDGDFIRDGCDVCPANAEALAADADNDGVGDRCDVDALVRHRWVKFEGFHGTAQGWVPKLGTWEVRTDSFASTDPLAGEAYLVVPATEQPVVEVAISGRSGIVLNAYAGVELFFDSATARCLYRHASGDDLLVLEVGGLPPMTLPFNAPFDVRIRMYQDDRGGIRCDAVSSTAVSGILHVDGLSSTVTTRAALVTANTEATFSWFALYGLDQP